MHDLSFEAIGLKPSQKGRSGPRLEPRGGRTAPQTLGVRQGAENPQIWATFESENNVFRNVFQLLEHIQATSCL